MSKNKAQTDEEFLADHREVDLLTKIITENDGGELTLLILIEAITAFVYRDNTLLCGFLVGIAVATSFFLNGRWKKAKDAGKRRDEIYCKLYPSYAKELAEKENSKTR
jgi:hypothetical protein